MSFMYKSMVTRAPGKRKIKLQEENILHLMQEDGNDDDDDEEDDDFKVTDDQRKIAEESNDESDYSEDTSSSSSHSGSSSDEVSNEVFTLSNITSGKALTKANGKRKRHPYESPTIQSTNAMIKSKYEGTSGPNSDMLAKMKCHLDSSRAVVMKMCDLPQERICCICLSKRNAHSIVVCNVCGISVHKDCYGGKMDNNFVDRSSTRWFCTACVSGLSPNCEFCPSTTGCIKETTNGQWCHIICARYILGKDMYAEGISNDLIDVSRLSYKRYGLRECLLCDESLYAKTGICVKCDAGLCKSYFHVTCAQKYGLLSENETDQNCETDPYFVYCSLHLGKEKFVEAQKLYITAFTVVDFTKSKNAAHNTRQNNRILNLFNIQRKLYAETQHSRYPSTPIEGEPPERMLTSDASALKALNRKAEVMFGINIKSPALYFPKPSDVRKRHHVAPALTGEFVSHYADRELRIVEMRERIDNAAEDNKAMIARQAELKEKYEELESDLETIKLKKGDTVLASKRLFSKLARLKEWAAENQTLRSSSMKKFIALKPEPRKPFCSERKSPIRKRGLHEEVTEVEPKSAKMSLSSEVLKKCGICHSNKHQHLLVNCDVCKRWLHLSCLDPPLTQFPKKTKFSLWQCSDCVSSSDDASDVDDSTRGSLITEEGRRHTRRPRKPPQKLSNDLISDRDVLEQKKMINQIKRMLRKTHDDKNKSYSSRLQYAKRNSGIKNRVDPRKKKNFRSTNNTFIASSKCFTKNRENANTLPESKVVVQRNTSLDEACVASSMSSPSEKSSLSPPKSSPSKNAAKLSPIISKPIILPSSSSVRLPGSAVPVKPIDKASLMSKFSPGAKPSGVADRLNTIVNSLKIRTEADIEDVLRKESNATKTNNSKSPKPPTTQSDFSTFKSKAATVSESSLMCCVCKTSIDVDKMMLCHSCNNRYHIWCCDPPLTSQMKLKKHFSWQCSSCCPSDEHKEAANGGGSETSHDGRRKITRRRRPPEKFANDFYSPSQRKMFESVLNRQNRVRVEKVKRKEVDLKRKLKKLSVNLATHTEKLELSSEKSSPVLSNGTSKTKVNTVGTARLRVLKKQSGRTKKRAVPVSRKPVSSVSVALSAKAIKSPPIVVKPVVTSVEPRKPVSHEECIKAAVTRLLTWERMSSASFSPNSATSQIIPSALPLSKATNSTTNIGCCPSSDSPSKLVTVIFPKPTIVKPLIPQLASLSSSKTDGSTLSNTIHSDTAVEDKTARNPSSPHYVRTIVSKQDSCSLPTAVSVHNESILNSNTASSLCVSSSSNCDISKAPKSSLINIAATKPNEHMTESSVIANSLSDGSCTEPSDHSLCTQSVETLPNAVPTEKLPSDAAASSQGDDPSSKSCSSQPKSSIPITLLPSGSSSTVDLVKLAPLCVPEQTDPPSKTSHADDLPNPAQDT